MLRITHSDTECQVEGTASEFAVVAAELRRLSLIGGSTAIACDSAFDPKPWPSRLCQLVLERREAKDRVAVVADSLALSGSEAGLVRLASFFDMPPDTPGGYHVHHEAIYSPDLIATESLPLVVCVR